MTSKTLALAIEDRKRALLPLLTAFRGNCELLLQELVLVHPQLLKLEPSLAAHYGPTAELIHEPSSTRTTSVESSRTSEEAAQRRADVPAALHHCLQIARDISAIVVSQSTISEAALSRLSHYAETCVLNFKKYSAPASCQASPKSSTSLVPQLAGKEASFRTKVSRALDFAKHFGAFACSVIEIVDSFVVLGHSMTEEEANIVKSQPARSLPSPESLLDVAKIGDVENSQNRLSFYILPSPSPLESLTFPPETKREASKRKGFHEDLKHTSKELGLWESFNRLSLMSLDNESLKLDFSDALLDLSSHSAHKASNNKSVIIAPKKDTVPIEHERQHDLSASSAKRPEHDDNSRLSRSDSANNKKGRKASVSIITNPYHDLPIWGNTRFGHEFSLQSRRSILSLSTSSSTAPCRLCGSGFSFIEKKYTCKACGCSIHKGCYREAISMYSQILKAPYAYKGTKAWQFQICNAEN